MNAMKRLVQATEKMRKPQNQVDNRIKLLLWLRKSSTMQHENMNM